MKLFNFLRKSQSTDLYKVRTVQFSELSKIDHSLDDIFDRNIDGLIIKNIFQRSEIDTMIERLRLKDVDHMDQLENGLFTYPEPNFKVNRDHPTPEARKEYFLHRRIFWKNIEERIGFDIIQHITALLQRISAHKTVSPCPGIDFNGHCNPLIFRTYPVGMGGLTVHCENQVYSNYSSYFGHLSSMTDMMDLISYVAILDPCELGGSLVLYDIEWKHAQVKVHNGKLASESGEEFDLAKDRKIRKQKIKLEAGDLVIFAAGQIWHKVDEIEGNKPRVTLGGFISKALNKDQFYIWS